MEYKLRDVKRGLEALGMKEARVNHHCTIFVKEGHLANVAIPSNHKGKGVHINLLQRELRKVNLTIKDFTNALK